MYRMTTGNLARVMPGLLFAVLVFSVCVLPGCIEMGEEDTVADAATPVQASARPTSAQKFVMSPQGPRPVFTPSGPAATPTPGPGTVGTIENAEPIPPAQAVMLLSVPSSPYATEADYADEMPTATFFEDTYKLMYNNAAMIATVERAPFVIEFWTSASSKNPYDALAVITVRNSATGDIVAEDGYNGLYSSDSYKRITIRDSGQFHVNVYGMRTTVRVKLRGGVDQQDAEPYGVKVNPTPTLFEGDMSEEEYHMLMMHGVI
jgi:hypothetical protein